MYIVQEFVIQSSLTKVLCLDDGREGSVCPGAQVYGFKLLGEVLEVTVSLPHFTLHQGVNLTNNLVLSTCMYM